MKRLIPALLAALLSCSAYAVDTYRIDPHHTYPMFEINHMGFSTQRGRFDKTAGTITLDRAKGTGSVNVTIDTNSLDMGSTNWEKHLKGPEFFDVAKYPTMTYTAHKMLFDKGEPVAALGKLTLLGVSQPVKLVIKRFRCGVNPLNKKSECGAEVSGYIRRSAFGMSAFVPLVGDQVHLVIPVEAYKE